MPGAGCIDAAGAEGLRHLPNYRSTEFRAGNIILVL